MFDDNWDASSPLYPQKSNDSNASSSRPPITLLLAAVSGNIFHDPSKEELAVAESVLAISVVETHKASGTVREGERQRSVQLCSMRMIDPPSRRTAPGVPSGTKQTVGEMLEGGGVSAASVQISDEAARPEGLWRAPVGGTKLHMIERMIEAVMEPGGGADEVLDGLEGVEIS